MKGPNKQLNDKNFPMTQNSAGLDYLKSSTFKI